MFKKGESGNPAGRPPGTPNKSRSIEALCKAKGVDPFEFMVDILNNESLDIHVQMTAAKELCQYLAPKKKELNLTLGEDELKGILIERLRSRGIEPGSTDTPLLRGKPPEDIPT